MLDDKFNGLTLSNYALQSHATDNVGTILYQVPQNTNGTQHTHNSPSATLRWGHGDFLATGTHCTGRSTRRGQSWKHS